MSMSTFDVQSINCKMEEIIDRLEDIVEDRDVLGLKEDVEVRSGSKQANGRSLHEQEEGDGEVIAIPSTKHAIKALTAQIKDTALKASVAYRNRNPCSGSTGKN